MIKGGPADKAGLKKNDVIINFRGIEINDPSALRNEVANTPIGHDVKVTILRDGKKIEVTVKTGNLKSSAKMLTALIKDRIDAKIYKQEYREETFRFAKDYK